MWTYRQSDGELLHDGEFIGTGYSGNGDGRNNPDMEDVPDVGPIPRGAYSIGPERVSDRLGPIVMNLEPVGHDALGRTLLRIHGDNLTHKASSGCVTLGRRLRQEMAASNDRELEVI